MPFSKSTDLGRRSGRRVVLCKFISDEDVHCMSEASWLVKFGHRVIDAQESCNRHLARTCEAILQDAEHELTVTRLRGARRV
jgi:hypothetical protein